MILAGKDTDLKGLYAFYYVVNSLISSLLGDIF
jgi:hypothetical protein